MPKTCLHLSWRVVGLAAALSSHAFAAGDDTWSYSGDTGPASWGQLSSAYATCTTGRNQSPVDLAGALEADLPYPEIAYGVPGQHVLNDGHTVRIDYPAGNAIGLEGRDYRLRQVHFHAPAEHTVEGREYPLEAHLVHAAEDGDLAVIAVLFEQAEASRAIASLGAQWPSRAADSVTLEEGLDPRTLLPDRLDHYRLNGSLTTPPCSEGVRWLVMKQPLTIGERSLEGLSRALGEANNRPVQPLNARRVLE